MPQSPPTGRNSSTSPYPRFHHLWDCTGKNACQPADNSASDNAMEWTAPTPKKPPLWSQTLGSAGSGHTQHSPPIPISMILLINPEIEVTHVPRGCPRLGSKVFVPHFGFDENLWERLPPRGHPCAAVAPARARTQKAEEGLQETQVMLNLCPPVRLANGDRCLGFPKLLGFL